MACEHPPKSITREGMEEAWQCNLCKETWEDTAALVAFKQKQARFEALRSAKQKLESEGKEFDFDISDHVVVLNIDDWNRIWRELGVED